MFMIARDEIYDEMEGGFILLLISAGLGLIVLILAVAYTYIYATQIKPNRIDVQENRQFRICTPNVPQLAVKSSCAVFMIWTCANKNNSYDVGCA